MLTDPASGSRTRVGEYVSAVGAVSFRSASPRIAAAFMPTPRCTAPYVMVADGAPDKILVKETDSGNCQTAQLTHVRWNPVRDEVLYRRAVSPKAELYAVGLAGASQRIVTQGDPVIAEWSPTGTQVLYIHRAAPSPFIGGELHLVRRDGSDDRVIFAPTIATLSDLVAKAYP